MNSTQLLSIAGIFLLAGLVKGVLGMGLPTVAMGLLGLLMPPAQAATLLLLPSLLTNAWQLFAGPDLGGLARRLAPMLALMAIATWAMAGWLARPGGWAQAALGGALMLYAGAGLARPPWRLPARAERWAGPAAGALTGAVTGITGVFVMPAVPYLGSLGLARDQLVQALGLSFTVSTLALGVGLASRQALAADAAWLSLLALLPASAGMVAGAWLRVRVRPEAFRRGFFIGLLILGAEGVWRSLG